MKLYISNYMSSPEPMEFMQDVCDDIQELQEHFQKINDFWKDSEGTAFAKKSKMYLDRIQLFWEKYQSFICFFPDIESKYAEKEYEYYKKFL